MSEIMTMNREWRARPDDERHPSIPAFHKVAEAARLSSRAAIVDVKDLTAAPVDGRPDEICIVTPAGTPAIPTNWAWRQISALAGAPASFLATLPSDLAADVFNHKMSQAEDQKAQIYLRSGAGATALAAVTGPDYGRINNSAILAALMEQPTIGDGVTGRFRVPGIRGKKLDKVTKENTTIFGSDRDMVICLADEDNRIEVKDRRDGERGSLARGVIIGNSEVGAGVFWITSFLFDFMCANRIIWGASEVKEIRVRHTSGAPSRWLGELMPQVQAYADASARTIEAGVKAAQAKMLGPKEEIDGFMLKHFTSPQVDKIHVAHGLAEHREIRSLWDVVTGATQYAQEIPFQNERLAVEKAAGALMTMV